MMAAGKSSPISSTRTSIPSPGSTCLFCAKHLISKSASSSNSEELPVYENSNSKAEQESQAHKDEDEAKIDINHQLRLVQIIFRYLNVQSSKLSDEALLVDIGENTTSPRSLSMPFCQTCRLATNELVKLQDQMDTIFLKINLAVHRIQRTIMDSSLDRDKSMELYFNRLKGFKDGILNREKQTDPPSLKILEEKVQDKGNPVLKLSSISILQIDSESLPASPAHNNPESVTNVSSEFDSNAETPTDEVQFEVETDIRGDPEKNNVSSPIQNATLQPIQVIIIQENSMQVECKHCGIIVENRVCLINHTKEFHDIQENDLDHNQIPNQDNLKKNPKKPHACKTCKKDFVKESALENHQRIHNGLPEYTCHICSKFFTIEYSFFRHMKLHETRKTFVCDQCGRRLSHVAEFRLHMKRHEGQFKFVCEFDWCQKGFLNKHALKKHMQYHKKVPLDALSHHCHICGPSKRFSKAIGLRTHLRNFHYKRNTFVLPSEKVFRPFQLNRRKTEDTISETCSSQAPKKTPRITGPSKRESLRHKITPARRKKAVQERGTSDSESHLSD